MTYPDNRLAVVELNHVALHVRDLDVSIRFYEEVLGLPLLPRPAFGFPGAWFALGSQELHLIVDATPRTGKPGHVALRVSDAWAAGQALREQGITNLSGPAPRPDGAIQVFFPDPDGHVIELVSLDAVVQP